MASLTSSPSPSSPMPEVPSRLTEGYSKSSKKIIQQRAAALETPGIDSSHSIDQELAGLNITAVDVDCDDDDEEEEENQTATGTTAQTTTTSTSSTSSTTSTTAPKLGHRMQSTKSLASFQSVDDAINHAIDQNVTVPEAFQQLSNRLSYRQSQVQIVNQGVLLRQTTDGADPEEKRDGAAAASSTNTDHSPSRSSSSSSSSSSSASPVSPAASTQTTCVPFASPSSAPKTTSEKVISAPSAVKHTTHVHFNDDLCKYEGLAPEASAANQQFGVPLKSVPKRKLQQYEEKIPSILVLLWNKVLEHSGETCMGIFRLAADADEMKYIKNNFNTGQYDGTPIEENIAATLIKIFFRELPTNLLNHVEKKIIDQIAGYDQMLRYKGNSVAVTGGGGAVSGTTTTMVVATTKELAMATEIFGLLTDMGFTNKSHYSLFLWLLDTMCTVVEHQDVNKMSAKNMAIVVAPNLYSIEDMSDPMSAMIWTQRIARFLEVVLLAKIAKRSVERRNSIEHK